MLPAPRRDNHCKNARRSNEIWECCSETGHRRMSQCLRRLVLVVSIFLFLIVCVVVFAAGKLAWTWWLSL